MPKKARVKGGRKVDLNGDSKVRYYHCNHRVIVCLVKHGRNIARGVAICSPNDNLCAEEGYRKAKGRAIRALYRKDSAGVICRPEAMAALKRAGVDFFLGGMPKSHFNPDLTPQEKNLLG